MLQVRDDLPALKKIFVVDPPAGDLPDGVYPASDLFESGEADLAELAAATDPSDLATLIYTSGTTGPPQGRDDQPVQRRLRHRDAAAVDGVDVRRHRRAADGVVSPDGAHRRAGDESLLGHGTRLRRLLLPRSRRAHGVPQGSAPRDPVRCAPRLGEDLRRRQRCARLPTPTARRSSIRVSPRPPRFRPRASAASRTTEEAETLQVPRRRRVLQRPGSRRSRLAPRRHHRRSTDPRPRSSSGSTPSGSTSPRSTACPRRPVR